MARKATEEEYFRNRAEEDEESEEDLDDEKEEIIQKLDRIKKREESEKRGRGQESEQPKQVLVEREITLSLINEKLNYLISEVTALKNKE